MIHSGVSRLTLTKISLSKATNEQLWVIMRSDADCPPSLLEMVVHEAIDRGMIKQYIVSTLRRYFQSVELGLKKLKCELNDIVQMGYEITVKAVTEYVPGRSSFTSFLYMKLTQLFGHEIQNLNALKRQAEVQSYNVEFQGDESLEYYLVDHQTNVEKTVIQKVMFEEKLSLLNEILKETFMLYFKGYTYQEIAQMLGSKKSAIKYRMDRSLETMTGRKINLKQIGAFERASFKRGKVS